jgi:pyruvate dehydrogenase E1 component
VPAEKASRAGMLISLVRIVAATAKSAPREAAPPASSAGWPAYALQRHPNARVTIAVMGAIVPEALSAAERLAVLGIDSDVLCITSPDMLFRAVRARQGQVSDPSWILDQVFPADRAMPLVTVLDGHPHTLAFLSAINNVRAANLGVDGFGQAGALAETYAYHHIEADSIITACLDLLGDTSS